MKVYELVEMLKPNTEVVLYEDFISDGYTIKGITNGSSISYEYRYTMYLDMFNDDLDLLDELGMAFDNSEIVQIDKGVAGQVLLAVNLSDDYAELDGEYGPF